MHRPSNAKLRKIGDANLHARGGHCSRSVLPTRDYGRCFNRSFCCTMTAEEAGSTMLRIAKYATLIVVLTMAAAFAQTNKQGLPGYSNAARTDQEKKTDREIDRAYESTIKGRPDAEKKNSDPWADVR